MATLKDYYKQGIADALKDLGDVIPDTTKVKLSDMELTVLALIGTGSQNFFQGSKTRGTKRRMMTEAGYELSGKGLINWKTRSKGYEASLTDVGQAYFDTLDSTVINSIVRQSDAQRERQAERENGQYAEMNQCDYCGKRGSNMYATDDGSIICEECSRLGKDQE